MIDHSTIYWVLAGFAAFFVGASKGGLPLVGLLSVPVLSQAVSPVVAAGLLLPIYLISDVYGLWIYRREYDLRNIKIIVPAAAIGVIVGWALARHTNENMVKIMVGVIGIAYCVDAILKAKRNLPARPADVPRGVFWGTIAGFTSYVSHSGGPPFQMYVLPQRLDKMVFAGTSTIVFAIINLMKLPPYMLLGQVNMASLKEGLLLAPISLMGAFIGYRLTTIVPQKLFFRIVEVALFILAVSLIYEGLVGLTKS
jgi:uncharacterized protein